MFSIQEAMFSIGTLAPLGLLAFSFVVGIVVSALSDWRGKLGSRTRLVTAQGKPQAYMSMHHGVVSQW